MLSLHCVVCSNVIDEKRARRGAVTCSTECSKELSKRRRDDKATRNCRLCGRRMRAPRAMDSQISATVNTAWRQLQDRLASGKPLFKQPEGM